MIYSLYSLKYYIELFARALELNKSGLKFITQHFHSEMNFGLRFSVIEIFMLVCSEMPRIDYKGFIFNALETGPF